MRTYFLITEAKESWSKVFKDFEVGTGTFRFFLLKEQEVQQRVSFYTHQKHVQFFNLEVFFSKAFKSYRRSKYLRYVYACLLPTKSIFIYYLYFVLSLIINYCPILCSNEKCTNSNDVKYCWVLSYKNYEFCKESKFALS